MSRTSRQKKAELRLRIFEDHYLADLTAALRDCASGTWGMFGSYDRIDDAPHGTELLKSKVVERLIKGGEEASLMRQGLGFTEPFRPFERLMVYRQMRGSNAPGEPKLAAQLLRELANEP